jgi:hypothetical protein
VKFSDFEKAVWVNEFVSLGWEQLRKSLEDTVLWALQPLVAQDFAMLPKLRLARFDFGPIPPFITAVAAYPRKSNVNYAAAVGTAAGLDISFVYGGQGLIALTASGMEIRVEDINISGRVRLIFTPLMFGWPCFSALTVSFLDKPKFTFKLRASVEKKQRAVQIPLLHQFVEELVDKLLSDYMLWPNKIPCPIFELSQEDKTSLAQKALPEGVASVRILEVTDLPKGTDVYCCLQSVQSKVKMKQVDLRTKTSTVSVTTSGELKAIWREEFQFNIYQEKSDAVEILLYSQKKIGGDRLLDRSTIFISELKRNELRERLVGLPETNAKLRMSVLYSTSKELANEEDTMDAENKATSPDPFPIITPKNSDDISVPELFRRQSDSKMKLSFRQIRTDLKKIFNARPDEDSVEFDSEADFEDGKFSVLESAPFDALLEIISLEVRDIPKSIIGIGSLDPYLVIKLIRSDVSRRLQPVSGSIPVWNNITLQIQDFESEIISFIVYDMRRFQMIPDRELAFVNVQVSSLLDGHEQECTLSLAAFNDMGNKWTKRKSNPAESNAGILTMKYMLKLLRPPEVGLKRTVSNSQEEKAPEEKAQLNSTAPINVPGPLAEESVIGQLTFSVWVKQGEGMIFTNSDIQEVFVEATLQNDSVRTKSCRITGEKPIVWDEKFTFDVRSIHRRDLPSQELHIFVKGRTAQAKTVDVGVTKLPMGQFLTATRNITNIQLELEVESSVISGSKLLVVVNVDNSA